MPAQKKQPPSLNYKGRVWTCDSHNNVITALLGAGNKKAANTVLRDVHPKKGNSCKECSRLYEDTPSVNR
jgi:hypothetical protein